MIVYFITLLSSNDHQCTLPFATVLLFYRIETMSWLRFGSLMPKSELISCSAHNVCERFLLHTIQFMLYILSLKFQHLVISYALYRRSTSVDSPNNNGIMQSSPSKKDSDKTTGPVAQQDGLEPDNAGSDGALKKEDTSKDGDDDMIEEGYVNVTGTSSGVMSPPVEIAAPPNEVLTPPTEPNNKVM